MKKPEKKRKPVKFETEFFQKEDWTTESLRDLADDMEAEGVEFLHVDQGCCGTWVEGYRMETTAEFEKRTIVERERYRKKQEQKLERLQKQAEKLRKELEK